MNTPIKGFKAVRNDMTARDKFRFRIGISYKIDESPIPCQRGFHFCKELEDVLDYYRFNSRFFEVEAYGEVVDEGNKSCTNHVRLVREITDEVKNSEEFQLTVVKKNPWAIQFIKNPSEEVQIAAIKGNGWTIEYIKNPSEKVQLAAVKGNGWVIKFISNPSEKVQLAAVNESGYAIEYIKNPSEAVKKAAGII